MEMGNWKKAAVPVLASILILGTLGLAGDVSGSQKAKTVTLEDLGILQLAAHDLFNIDRGNGKAAATATEFENGRLDLSTLLRDTTNNYAPFSDSVVAIGGEVRNRENVQLFTVASELGQFYLDLKQKVGQEEAYDKTIQLYHKKLKKVYELTFEEPLPSPLQGDVNCNQNLAFRTIHDMLRGTIKYNGDLVNIFQVTHGDTLSKSELNQKSSELDGQFDEEFLNIMISVPNGPTIMVNLLEADSNFAKQFKTDFTFEYLLEELEDGHYDSTEDVMQLIRELIAKGLDIDSGTSICPQK